MRAVRIESASASHPGRVRAVNEDALCDRPIDGVWAVADGMGGHAHGDWASATLAASLAALALPDDFDAAAQAVAAAIHDGNRVIWQEAQARTQQMGSTVVALLVRDNRFALLWVGDSRAYLLRDGRIHPLSRDHSQVQEMVDRGLISAEEARVHPRRNVLARAVGVADRLEVDAIADDVAPGDTFLLCSDGLTGLVDDDELARILRDAGGREAAVAQLVALALDRGAPDNVTAVVVSVQEATALSLAGLPGGFA